MMLITCDPEISFKNYVTCSSFFSFAGQCPIYNYAFGATTATGRNCTNFAKGCPDPKYSPYHSSSFYKCTFSFLYFSPFYGFHFFRIIDYLQILNQCDHEHTSCNLFFWSQTILNANLFNIFMHIHNFFLHAKLYWYNPIFKKNPINMWHEIWIP